MSYDFADDGGGDYARSRPAPAYRADAAPKPSSYSTARRQPASSRALPRSLSEFYGRTHPADGDAAGGDAGDGTVDEPTIRQSTQQSQLPPSAPSSAGMEHLATLVGFESEAARMLRQLYGRPKPVSAPPKPRLAAWSAPGKWERPMHAAETARDPRDDRIDHEAQDVIDATKPPAVIVREVHVAPVEMLKGRRSAAQIATDRARAAETEDISAPPMKRGYNTEQEKRKLQAYFAMKGGKALPDSGMPEGLEGHIPMQLITGKRAPSAAAARRSTPMDAGGIASAFGMNSSEARLLSVATPDELAMMAECSSSLRDLSQSIVETRAFASELSGLGAMSAERHASLDSEIVYKQSEIASIKRTIVDIRHAIAARAAALPPAPTITAAARGGGGGGGDEYYDTDGYGAGETHVSSHRPSSRPSSGLSASGKRTLQPATLGTATSGPRIVTHAGGGGAVGGRTLAARKLNPSPIRSPARR